MEINFNLQNQLNIENKKLTKMIFLFNALENGWSVKKSQNNYLFKKKHQGKKEIFSDKYLSRFLGENFDFNQFIFVED